jgi:hypothetical protein
MQKVPLSLARRIRRNQAFLRSQARAVQLCARVGERMSGKSEFLTDMQTT